MTVTAEFTRQDLFNAPFAEYTENVLSIVTKETELVPFALNYAQRYVDAKLSEQWEREGRIRAIILKARQLGISTEVAGRFFRRVQTRKYQRAVVMADTDDRAGTLFNIYDNFDTNLAREFRPLKRASARQRLLVYANPDKNTRQDNPGLNSSISVKSARDKNAGRSMTIHMAHLSEMAFWDDGEATFISLMSAVPDMGSEVIIESTANGVGDLFHQTWQEAEAGENGFIAIFIPWYIMPEYRRPCSKEQAETILGSMDEFELKAYTEGVEFDGENWKLDMEQLQWRRETCRQKCKGDWNLFAQEYPATAEEAFIVSGAQFFDMSALKDYIEKAESPIQRGDIQERVVHNDETGADEVRIEITDDTVSGYVRIWDLPSKDGHYVIGADTAEGKLIGSTRGGFFSSQSERGGRDFSCGQVYDVYKHKLVAQIHGRMAPEIFADKMALLGRYYGCRTTRPAMIGVEMNHKSGSTVVNRLLDVIGYPLQYMRYVFNVQGKGKTREFGWTTSAETRPLMLDELAEMVRNRTIDIPDLSTLQEMTWFVRGEDGKPEAQTGQHDDRVMSLAISRQIAKVHACSSGKKPEPTSYDPVWGKYPT